MQANLLFFIVITNVLIEIRCESNWTLVFANEFEVENFDFFADWDLDHEKKECEGNYIGQLNCIADSTDHVRVFEGTLVLAAIREQKPYLNRDYSSPRMRTKRTFTYGKFEMRVALPQGKMLRPWISLLSTQDSEHSIISAKNGEIDILINHQNQIIPNGIHYSIGNNSKSSGNESVIEANLHDFHIYTFEWSEDHMIWTFDNKILMKLNLIEEFKNEKYNPFTKPFKLWLNLGVGGRIKGKDLFPDQTLVTDDADNWECPLLILDYVRVYQKNTTDITSKHHHDEEARLDSHEICEQVVSTLRPKKPLTAVDKDDEIYQDTQMEGYNVYEDVYGPKTENDDNKDDSNEYSKYQYHTNEYSDIEYKNPEIAYYMKMNTDPEDEEVVVVN